MISVRSRIGGRSAPPGFRLYSASARVYKDVSYSSLPDDSIYQGASPAIVNGDMGVVSATSSPGGYANTLAADGTVSIDAGGDTSRQSFTGDGYDYSLRAWGGLATFYVNNVGPNFVDPSAPNPTVVIRTGEAFTFDILALAEDAEDDPLTVTVSPDSVDTPPTGSSLTDGDFAGTVNAEQTAVITWRWTDIAEDYLELTKTYAFIDQVTVPNVVGETAEDAATIIEGENLTYIYAYAYSDTIPEGEVISQDPAAATEVDPGTTVTLVVSRGPVTGSSVYGFLRPMIRISV